MEISRTEPVTLTAGDYIVFDDDVVIPPSRCMYYNKTTGLTTLIGKTNNCYAVFKITFTGDLASETANTVAALSISVDGVNVEKSEMFVTSTAANDTYSVARTMFLKVPRGTSSKVGIRSTGAAAETALNSILIIERVS